MKKDPLIFVEHILDNIGDIENFSNGLSKDEISKNNLKQKAIIRSIEVIGEAVKNIPMSFRKEHPEIEWKKIAGTRDMIIHAYFDVDLDIVWGIIKKDIPDLKKKIEKIKEELE